MHLIRGETGRPRKFLYIILNFLGVIRYPGLNKEKEIYQQAITLFRFKIVIGFIYNSSYSVTRYVFTVRDFHSCRSPVTPVSFVLFKRTPSYCSCNTAGTCHQTVIAKNWKLSQNDNHTSGLSSHSNSGKFYAPRRTRNIVWKSSTNGCLIDCMELQFYIYFGLSVDKI